MAKIRQHRLMHSVAVAVAGQYATPIRALKVLPLDPIEGKDCVRHDFYDLHWRVV